MPSAYSQPAVRRLSVRMANDVVRACRASVASYAPRPRMLVFGAIDFAAAVARIGSFLGYSVTVCDARPVFATRSRFPAADEVVVSWPHKYLAGEVEAGAVDGRTVICVLTHDPKFDVRLLEVALRIPEVGYIGAMGSRRTHEDRERRVREAGLSDDELARLSSPIGLTWGGANPGGDRDFRGRRDHRAAMGRRRRPTPEQAGSHPRSWTSGGCRRRRNVVAWPRRIRRDRPWASERLPTSPHRSRRCRRALNSSEPRNDTCASGPTWKRMKS